MPITPSPDPQNSLCASPSLSRRMWLQRAGVATAAALLAVPLDAASLFAQPTQIPRTMTVYKTPTCGCCTEWVKHVEAAGFKVTIRDLADLREVKAAFGIPAALQSCHTGQIGSYLVEGHVPADLITKMLREKPAGRGLAVPGMPVGSPGMEGGTPERYQILLFDKAGGARVYATR